VQGLGTGVACATLGLQWDRLRACQSVPWRAVADGTKVPFSTYTAAYPERSALKGRASPYARADAVRLIQGRRACSQWMGGRRRWRACPGPVAQLTLEALRMHPAARAAREMTRRYDERARRARPCWLLACIKTVQPQGIPSIGRYV